jgi:Ankyrin repeats (3 copies)
MGKFLRNDIGSRFFLLTSCFDLFCSSVNDTAEGSQKDYSPTTLRQRLSPRGMRSINKKKDMYSNDDVSNMSLCTLIEKRKWKVAVARIIADPLSAERDLKVMTRGGFMASTGMSPLHYACERRPPVSLVRVLIDAFPFAVLTRAMPGGCLPLHIACTWGASPEIVEALLSADHGSVKVKDELGNVALHSACFSGADIRIVAMLLAADGKSIVARNHQGSRPIDISKRLRHDNRRDVMSLLNRRKEEIMRAHHRSRSSGLLVDIAKEAELKNSR